MNPTVTFRIPFKAKIREIVACLFLTAYSIVLPFLLRNNFKWILSGISLLISWLIFRYVLLPAYRTWIRIDDTAISGRIQGALFRLRWHKIRLALANTGPDESPVSMLQLGTAHQMLGLPLEGLDGPALCEAVRQRVPPASLTHEAYVAWVNANQLDQPEQLILPRPLKVDLNKTERAQGFFILGIMSPFVILSSFQDLAVAGFFFAVGGSSLLALLPSQLKITSEGLTKTTVWSTRTIRWDEIKRIKSKDVGRSRTEIEFSGAHKKLNVPDFDNWRGADCSRILTFIYLMARARGIDCPILSLKNTRALSPWWG